MAQRAWKYLVDSELFTKLRFLKEAQKKGVCLPVSLKQIRHMQWNDPVACFQKGTGIKSLVWFATFPVTIVSGFSQKAMVILADKLDIRPVGLGGLEVARRIGTYTEGMRSVTDDPIWQISEVLMKEGEAEQVYIGCGANVIQERRKKYPAFVDIQANAAGLHKGALHEFLIDDAEEQIGFWYEDHSDKRPLIQGQYDWMNMAFEGDDNLAPAVPAIPNAAEWEGRKGGGLLVPFMNNREGD